MNSQEENLSWSAPEYEEKEKNADWFWALGIIVVTSVITAIIYGNYFFAALLFMSGILLGVFAKKKPIMVSYTLNNKGLSIGDRLYPYENIKAFFVQQHNTDKGHKPTLFLKTERIFMPILSVPIENEWVSGIQELMQEKNIKEEEMREHVSEKIMESLGF